ncbi:MAG: FAD-dependent monooxygenase [Planctomycetota bacterium]
MKRADFDAVVIGAGPAGALAARGLALAGHAVLLVDRQRFPRAKVCGCCLNRYALTNLGRAGLGDLVGRLGAPALERLKMVAGGRSAELPLPPGVSLSREALDTALIDIARQTGAEFREGVSAKVLPAGERDMPQHRVNLLDGETVTCRAVVVADGLGGTSLKHVPGFEVATEPASRLGFGGAAAAATAAQRARLDHGTILMACGQSGYLGAVELEDGGIDLAAAVDASAVKAAGGWAAAAKQLVAESGLPADALPIENVACWRATPALTRRRAKLAGPGLFVVGDAAGYVEPFTGEGMAWAIAGGTAVVPIAAQAIAGWDVQQEIAWQNVFARNVRRRQAGCRLVAATLRRPWLTRSVVRLLATAPACAAPLVRHITRPGDPRLAPPPGAATSGWSASTGTAA